MWLSIDRKRSRAAVNRTQAGIRSRPRRPGAEIPPRASAWPLHEGSSEAQSAKTGSDPTAAHELSAARLRKEWVFQFPQQADTTRPHALSISFSFNTPTYPQRTRSAVTLAASSLRLSPTTQPACERKPTVADKVNDALDRRPGEKVRDAAEDTRDAVKDASKDVKDAVKETTK